MGRISGLAVASVATSMSLLLIDNSAAAGERLALLIGNSRYEYASPLRNPENDVALVSQSLEKAGFKTFVETNLDFVAMKAAMEKFVSAARAEDYPTVLVYFAGHGVQVDGRNYVIPTDARVEDAEGLARVALSADDLLSKLSAIDADLQIIVLDACRDDPFENATRGLARGLSEAQPTSGRLIAYSTAPGTVASDGDTGTSPYASAIAEAILIPGLRLEDTFKRVRATVYERTSGKQEPWETAALYTSFAFIPAAAEATMPAAEEEYWNLASIVNSPEAYQKYIELHPDGLFNDLARLKIDSIKGFHFQKEDRDVSDRNRWCRRFRFLR